MTDFFVWLGRVDRRWIFLVMAFAVAIPLAMQRPAPVEATAIVRNLYDRVDGLEPGSRVLLSLDYGPSTQPENDPMSYGVARHCLRKDLQVFLVTTWATGPPMIEGLIESVVFRDFPDKVYGVDYVNLGYKVGEQGLIQSLTSDFKGQYTSDAGIGERSPSRPTDQIPMMDRVTTLSDFALLVPIGSGWPGVKEWVQFAGDPLGIDVGGGVTAVEAPLLYPYYPQQLIGLMGGLAGAAEYEALLTENFPEFRESGRAALIRMFPQTVAHLVIIGFVVLGNISYFVVRRRDGRR